MGKKVNPFGIRKAPVEIISAQAVTLEDYLKKSIDETERSVGCTTISSK